MKLYEKNDERNPNGARKTHISLWFRMALIKELAKRLHSYGASKFNGLPCFAAGSLPTKVKISSDVIEEKYDSMYFVFTSTV